MVGGRPTDNESLLIELGETGLHGTVYWVYSGFDRSPEIQKDGAAIYGECNCSVARSGPRDGGRWRNVPRLYSVYLSLHQSQQGGGRGEFRTIHAFHRLCRYGQLLQTIHHRPRRPLKLSCRKQNPSSLTQVVSFLWAWLRIRRIPCTTFCTRPNGAGSLFNISSTDSDRSGLLAE